MADAVRLDESPDGLPKQALDLLLRFRTNSTALQAGPVARRPIGLDHIFYTLFIRGCSSVGRAPDLHSGGRRFDPDQLHQVATDVGGTPGPVAQVARAHP